MFEVLLDEIIQKSCQEAADEQILYSLEFNPWSGWIQLSDLDEDFQMLDPTVEGEFETTQKSLEPSWSTGINCVNVKGFGNSRSTFFREKRKKKQTMEAALKNSQDIMTCWKKQRKNEADALIGNNIIEINDNDDVIEICDSDEVDEENVIDEETCPVLELISGKKRGRISTLALACRNSQGSLLSTEKAIEHLNIYDFNCKSRLQKGNKTCTLLFAFDNSMSHQKRAPDGLDASLLNLSDGGANIPKFRSTKFERNGEVFIQLMHREDGKQLGLKSILHQRGKWPANGLRKRCEHCLKNIPKEARVNFEPFPNHPCCAFYVVSQEKDFLEQKEWLSETVEAAGCEIIYYPKYHCELNYIEMIWGYLKRKLRENCTYNFKELQALLPQQLESIPISFVRKAARHCYRFMSGYRIGLEGPQLEYVVKKFKTHRYIPRGEVERLIREHEQTSTKK